MKQKIVIKVAMNGQKSRSKSLRIAVGLQGVEHAGLGGAEKDQIEVIGDGIDAAQLTDLLRKKVGFADLVSVTAVGGQKKEERKEEPKVMPMVWTYGVPASAFCEMRDNYPSQYHDPYACSIM